MNRDVLSHAMADAQSPTVRAPTASSLSPGLRLYAPRSQLNLLFDTPPSTICGAAWSHGQLTGQAPFILTEHTFSLSQRAVVWLTVIRQVKEVLVITLLGVSRYEPSGSRISTFVMPLVHALSSARFLYVRCGDCRRKKLAAKMHATTAAPARSGRSFRNLMRRRPDIILNDNTPGHRMQE